MEIPISLLLTEYSNCFRSKLGSSFTVLVNIFFESLIGNIHLAKSYENFISASIVILSDIFLQFAN